MYVKNENESRSSQSGYHLISKAGKTSINRHKILKEKDQILGHHPSTLQGKKSQNKKKKISVLEALIKSLNPSPPVDYKSEEKSKIESFSVAQSPKLPKSPKDSNLDNILKSRELFSPSYKAQDKHIPTVKFKKNLTVKRKPLEKIVKIHHHSEAKLKPIAIDKIGLTFEKQLSRDFLWMKHNLSEKRFEFYPAPVQIKSGPSFDKQVARSRVFGEKDMLPDYYPQKEKVLKKISKNIDFDKYLERKLEVEKKFLPDSYDLKFR
jgi:hypothetical protein